MGLRLGFFYGLGKNSRNILDFMYVVQRAPESVLGSAVDSGECCSAPECSSGSAPESDRVLRFQGFRVSGSAPESEGKYSPVSAAGSVLCRRIFKLC